MRDENEERKKQARSNKQTNKAKQHSTPKAVTFPELPRVGLEPTTLYTLDRALMYAIDRKKAHAKPQPQPLLHLSLKTEEVAVISTGCWRGGKTQSSSVTKKPRRYHEDQLPPKYGKCAIYNTTKYVACKKSTEVISKPLFTLVAQSHCVWMKTLSSLYSLTAAVTKKNQPLVPKKCVQIVLFFVLSFVTSWNVSPHDWQNNVCNART